MKIEYHKNPLFTKVILDEHEQEIFKLKIKLNELTEAASQAHFELTHHEWRNSIKGKPQRTLEETMKEAASWIDDEFLYADDGPSGLDKRTDEMFKYYMSDLVGGHAGDCICVPCSCVKCHAEEILGVDTMKGLGKHSASKINAAFGRNNEKTIDEVLEELRAYDPKPPTDPKSIEQWDKAGGWAKHLPRWKDEALKAHEWLLNYRNTLYAGT